MRGGRTLDHMFAGTLPQLIPALTATCGALSDGMQYGWSAPFIPRYNESDSPFHFTESDETWLETIYMIGGCAGLPVTIYLVDKIGRKKSLMAASFTSLIGWLLTAFAQNVNYLLAARFLTGVAGDMAFVSAPMYIAEIADQKIRGFLASLIIMMMLAGTLLVYSIAPYTPIYVCSIVGSCVLVFQLILFPFMPDSPYYLLGKGKEEKARMNLARLRSNCDIDKELSEIKVAVERQRAERGRIIDLFIIKSNRKAVIIMTVLNGAQHFSSISVMLMNLHLILNAAGSIYMDSKLAAITFSILMLLAAGVSSLVIDKYGRKCLLVVSSTLTGISLTALALYFNLKETGVDVSAVSWIPIAAVMLYASVFKFGLGMIPIVLTAELFPSNVKAMGMTISDLMYVFFGLISIYLYQITSKAFGLYVPFYIFSFCCFATALVSAFYIPETKGKTLEEIQYILKGEPYPHIAAIENGEIIKDDSIVLKEKIGISNVDFKNGDTQNGDSFIAVKTEVTPL